MRIVSRKEWGARAPRRSLKVRSYENGWFVHWHGSTYRDGMAEVEILQAIQNYHMDDPSRRYDDIGYSFAIGRSTEVYELRGWDRVGAHTHGFNSTSLGVLFIVGPDDPPVSGQMWDAFIRLRSMGIGYGVPEFPVRAHHSVGTTDCPGPGLADLIAGLGTDRPAETLTGEDYVRAAQRSLNDLYAAQPDIPIPDNVSMPLKVDGVFGGKSLAAVQGAVRELMGRRPEVGPGYAPSSASDGRWAAAATLHVNGRLSGADWDVVSSFAEGDR